MFEDNQTKPMDDTDAWGMPLGSDDTQVGNGAVSKGHSTEPAAQPLKSNSNQRSKTTTNPAQATGAVSAPLKAAPPVLKTPPADALAGFKSETEVKHWAFDKAMSHPVLSDWTALGNSSLQEVDDPKRRLLAQQSRLMAQIEQEPDEVTVPVRVDEDGLAVPMVRPFILLGAGGAACVALVVLISEFVFDTVVAMESSYGFAQSLSGARSMVGAMSFGSFVAISYWMACEKHETNWTDRRVARIGMVLTLSLVVIAGVALGKSHVEEGFFGGLPLLIVPLVAGVLISAAIAAKAFTVWVATMAFPKKVVRNGKLKTLWNDLTGLEGPLSQLRKSESNALALIERARSVANEFSGRVSALWIQIKSYESKQEMTRQAHADQAIAEAKAKLAKEDFDTLERPE